MIDSERRKNLALNLRHLSVGLITNDEFECNISNTVTEGWLPEQYYRSDKAKNDDPVIVPMLELCWGLYSDLKNYKLKGNNKLPDESLKTIAKCILFLQSNIEFEWPKYNDESLMRFSLTEILFGLVTLGYYFREKRKQQILAFEEYKKLGDYRYWPFFRSNDYEDQLNHQPFLRSI